MMKEPKKKSGWGKWVFLGGIVLLFLIVAPPWYGRPTGRSYQSKQLSNSKQVALAIKLYAIDSDGKYPDTLDQLEEGNYLPGDSSILENLRGEFRFGQEGPIEYLTPGVFEKDLAPDTPILQIPWEGDRWIQVTANYSGQMVDREPKTAN